MHYPRVVNRKLIILQMITRNSMHVMLDLPSSNLFMEQFMFITGGVECPVYVHFEKVGNWHKKVQYRSNVSYHLSSRFSRDSSHFSRDESRFLRDASRFARESLKHLVWNILLLARSQRAYQRRCYYTHM